jgi:hypothetical protein
MKLTAQCNDCFTEHEIDTNCDCPHQDGGRWILLLIPLSIVLGCLLSGCGITAREAVQRGAARWQGATNLTAPMPQVRARWGTFECGDLLSVTGCWDGTTIEIDMSRSDEEIERTATHEWGHLLGADHHKHAGVMGPKGNPDASHCISLADIWELCGDMSCEWERPECK